MQLLYNALFFLIGSAFGYLLCYWIQTRHLRKQMDQTLSTVNLIKNELDRIEKAYKETLSR